VRAALTPDVKVIFMQATESSTGARHPVAQVARLVRESGALLVVDAITGLGTTEFDVDGWGIDVIIGGSQKAVMIPPGLAYCAVSDRAWKMMETSKSPRFYFDLRKERAAGEKGESAFTPAISLVAGLNAALDYIRAAGNGDLAAGRDALIHNAEVSAEMTRAAAKALRLQLFSPDAPSNALTAIIPPAGVDSGDIVKDFRERFGAVVANGQGEMKGKVFRIAHLGFYDYLDTLGIIGALEHVVVQAIKPKHIELGAGLRAAQEAYIRAGAQTLVASR
jgi:aspartate aminotransferase-like enzyme